ncbi:hypothetical protein FV228_03645 [Methylobacterium sp. WL18]|uniref:hypothetical protein n=1 Tax=Methylobacterium sp. WL18 TaxID=2603897 RepID=UPI0011C8495B|nr:hypothetical protein [Methylobacterium sp. WL18]TXN75526.1 hypothetical protein FV228_03645 [Methylobacterium sp. WL18]
MVKLGLASGKARYVEALAFLIAEACLAAREGRRVSVSLNSNYWTGMQHVFGRASTLTFVREALKLGEAAGVLKLKKAPANPWDADGMQSTFALTPAGQEYFGNDPTYERRELVSQSNLVRLKDLNKNYLRYTPNAFSRDRFARLLPLNERLMAVAIGTQNPNIRTYEDGLWIIPGGRADRRGNTKDHVMRSDARILHATFNNGDWDQGGRTSGLFTMQLPKAERGQLKLDGKPVELIDFSCSHPRIAYAEARLPLEGDAYLIRGWEGQRDFVKRALNTALNAADPKAAWASIAFRLADPNARRAGRTRTDIRPEACHWRKAAEVLEAIVEHHDQIRQAFFTGAGLRFMRTEADVMLDTMTEAHRCGMTLLPTYDEFVVRHDHACRTRELMLSNWHRVVGREGVVSVVS